MFPFFKFRVELLSHCVVISLISLRLSISLPVFPPPTMGVFGRCLRPLLFADYIPVCICLSLAPFILQEMGLAVISSSLSGRNAAISFYSVSLSLLLFASLFRSKCLRNKIRGRENNSPVGPFHSAVFYFLLFSHQLKLFISLFLQ